MAQAARNELASQQRHQQQLQQQVSTTNKTGRQTKTPPSEAPSQPDMPATTSQTVTSKTKPSYKHIPHSQKPPHLVAKRNARERRRVQAVNQAFYKLRKCVPIQNRNKRVSKVKTLQRAIDYIRDLEIILAEDEARDGERGGQLAGRILVSSQAGDEAELRLAMSPAPPAALHTPARRARAQPVKQQQQQQQQQVSAADSSDANQAAPKPRRGRKPNGLKAAADDKRQQLCGAATAAPALPTPDSAARAALPAGFALEPHASYAPEHQAAAHQVAYYQAPATPPTCPPAGYYQAEPVHYQHHNQQNQQPAAAQYASEPTHGHYYQPFHEPHAYQNQPQPQAQQQAHFQPHHHYSNSNYYSPTHQVPYGIAIVSDQTQADSSCTPRTMATSQQPQHNWHHHHHHQQHQQHLQDHQHHHNGNQNQQPVSCGTPVAASGLIADQEQSPSRHLSQLALNSSGSSSSGAGHCLFSGQVVQARPQARRVTSMPADSTSSCGPAAGGNKTAPSSLVDSPYSTASTASSSSSSCASNKSLDLTSGATEPRRAADKLAKRQAPSSAYLAQFGAGDQLADLYLAGSAPEQQAAGGYGTMGYQQQQQQQQPPALAYEHQPPF